MPPVLGFEEFYSGVYLPEHQDARCRGLHYVGTAAALAFAAARPATFLSSAAAVGARPGRRPRRRIGDGPRQLARRNRLDDAPVLLVAVEHLPAHDDHRHRAPASQ